MKNGNVNTQQSVDKFPAEADKILDVLNSVLRTLALLACVIFPYFSSCKTFSIFCTRIDCYPLWPSVDTYLLIIIEWVLDTIKLSVISSILYIHFCITLVLYLNPFLPNVQIKLLLLLLLLLLGKRVWLRLVGFRSSFRFFSGAKCLQIVQNLTRAWNLKFCSQNPWGENYFFFFFFFCVL